MGSGAYAVFQKAVQFKASFDHLHDRLLFPVGDGYDGLACFGIDDLENEDLEVAKQIKIYDHRSFDNFIVSFEFENPDDEMVCAVIPQPETLLEAYEQVRERISETTPETMAVGESIRMPYVSFDVAWDNYSALTEGTRISRIGHRVRFTLNRTGAGVVGIGDIADFNGAEPEVRDLLFNKPFLVYMKRASSELPYFVAWIGNTDFLQKHN